MKKMHKKNRLYVLPALLFFVGLQGTEAKTIPSKSTQTTALETNTDVSSDTDTDNDVNQQALDAYDVAITRVHNRPNKPKPNNTASQNTAGAYSMQNMPASQQNIIRPQNNMLGSQYTQPQNMPESQQSITWSPNNMSESQQYNNQYYQNQAQLSDSQAQIYNNQEQYDNTQMQYYSDSAQYGTSQGQDNNGNQPQYAGNQEQYNNSQWYYSNNQEQPTGYTSNQGQNYNSKIDYTNDNTQQNSAGSPDTTFRSHNTTGTITLGYVINEMGFRSAPRAVTVQKDNKIVVAGERDEYPVLVRYNNNGALDKDFGGVGTYGPGVTIQTSLGKKSYFNAVAIDTQCDCNQKIVAAGSAAGKGIIARYYHDGTLDTAFGDKGIIRTNIAGELNAIAIDADSNIVVAGVNTITTSNTHIIVMRFDSKGNLDNNFGTRGVVLTQVGAPSRANAMVIQKDNKIVVAGTVNSGNRTDMIIVRYNANGTLDPSFGLNNSGMRTFNIENKNSVAYDVVIQQNGAILVAGSSISPNNSNLFTIIRLQHNGSPDTSFGTNGIVAISPTPPGFPNHHAYARSVALDENDKIIVMGYIMEGNYNYFALVRLNHDGTKDTTFGTQGNQYSILKQNATSLNQAAIPVFGAIQNDKKKLVLAGMYSGKYSPTASLMAVARYLNS